MAGGGAGAVEGGLTETLVRRSLHSNIGGEAMRQTRLSYSTETGPSCSRILGFAGGGAQLDTSRSIAQPHRVLDLHNGPLSVENWRCLETQAYYCMTSKNVLMLIKFLSMTTLFALLNHSILVCLIP